MRLYDKDINKYVVNSILFINKRLVNDIFSIDGVIDSSEQRYPKNLEIHEIKTVSKIIIENIHYEYLTISLIKCEVKVVEVINIQIDLLQVSNHNPGNSKTDDISHNFKKSQILEIRASVFERFYIEESSFKRIKVDNCEILSDAIIEKNNNLEGCYFNDTEVHSLDILGPAGIKHINLGGNKEIKYVSIKNLNYDKEISNFFFHCPINDLKITECRSNIYLKIIGKEFGNIDLDKKSTFKSIRINHKSANIKINDCTVEEKLTIDLKSTINEEYNEPKAISPKFEITNNTIGKGISFENHHIKDEFKIEGNRLENGRWEFYGFSLDENCKSEIAKQSYKDATFQNCDFSNFDFKDTSIHLAEIIESTWKEVDIAGQKRILFKAEKEALEISDLDQLKTHLKELKKQYSFFRKKFEDENNYLDASKFKISAALTRIKIEKRGRKLLLYFNKWLNMFGESIARPFKWYFGTLVIFAIIYLLTGFHIGEDQIKYKIVLKGFKDYPNLDFPSICEIGESLLFSFKNISPVKLEYDFDFRASRPTQIISMLQKLINIILVGALYASMRNFFRK